MNKVKLIGIRITEELSIMKIIKKIMLMKGRIIISIIYCYKNDIRSNFFFKVQCRRQQIILNSSSKL